MELLEFRYVKYPMKKKTSRIWQNKTFLNSLHSEKSLNVVCAHEIEIPPGTLPKRYGIVQKSVWLPILIGFIFVWIAGGLPYFPNAIDLFDHAQYRTWFRYPWYNSIIYEYFWAVVPSTLQPKNVIAAHYKSVHKTKSIKNL